MTLEEAQALVAEAAEAAKPGNHWQALRQRARPAPRRAYEAASFEASAQGKKTLGEAVRRLAREDLEALRRQGKGLGPEARELREAAGLPTAKEDYEQHGTFFPNPKRTRR